ncbi:MAG: N-acetylmuramoyl-L-alanine amidase, partial [Verrucomicrobiae bacterium]|nr:N-acetylmuramoyl-L-alanine amidase [Verrucomicrobiae bacterium]
SDLAATIRGMVTRAEIVVTSRDDKRSGYRTLPAKINALDPNFVVSLHANGDDGSGTANGSEVLHWHTSKEGRKLASLLQDQFLSALKLRDRKLKPRTETDRGGSLLRDVRAPIVIGEPFFITNQSDLAAAMAGKEKLAAAYAAAIDVYATMISNPPETKTSSHLVASHVAPAANRFEFKSNNLTKRQFLDRNRKELDRMIDAVNARLAGEYDDAIVPVSLRDVWVITNCEAGLRSGKVDPDHRHSEGERGLLPLPENIRYWTGNDAPVWDRPMPLARNLEYFFLYLGQLKNKQVTKKSGRWLYRDLFRETGIGGDPVREAKLLAGVVHGYFYSGTYSDKKVPISYLLDGYRSDRGLAEMMASTHYVHAGKPLMAGRERNIEEALGWL